MQDEKKSDPPKPASGPKPLVTQVIEAVIDDAAEIAKAVAIGAVARAGEKAKKTEVGKAAVAIVKKAESLRSPVKPKKAAAKKSGPAKKSLAKKSGAKKPVAKNASSKGKKPLTKR
jgi:hypothetical protein